MHKCVCAIAPQVPSNPKNKLRNPLELFTYGSLHGGIWRMAYKVCMFVCPGVACLIHSCIRLSFH